MSTEPRQTILDRLTGITELLSTIRSLDTLAAAIHQIVEDTIDVEYLGFFLIDFGTGELLMLQSKGFSPQEREEALRTAWDRHPGWVIRNQQMLHVPDTALDNRTQTSKRSIHVRSRLWLPVVADGKAVGAIGLASATPSAFATEHIRILQYAAATTGFMYANLRDKWSLEQQFRIAEEQRRELEALSSPIVEVSKGVVVLPIIGHLGDDRAKQITEKLLDVVVSRALHAVILDLTGVATMDGTSIDHLEQMHRAVRLLGGDCLFSGISGQTAALMTQMGIDIGHWKTFANVRMALGALRLANRNDEPSPSNKPNRG